MDHIINDNTSQIELTSTNSGSGQAYMSYMEPYTINYDTPRYVPYFNSSNEIIKIKLVYFLLVKVANNSKIPVPRKPYVYLFFMFKIIVFFYLNSYFFVKKKYI